MPNRQTYESYTVVKGDTVAALAKRYRTTVAAIAATSGLKDANKIKPGQVLFIPVQTAIFEPAELSVPNADLTPAAPTAGGDPVAAAVNAAASWLKPPRLWVTIGVAIGIGAYLLDPPRRPRRRR